MSSDWTYPSTNDWTYQGRRRRTVVLPPTQHKLRQPIPDEYTDQDGVWRQVQLDESRGAHPLDQEARGEWYTRRVTYELEEQP
jgi:hypothetical protein